MAIQKIVDSMRTTTVLDAAKVTTGTMDAARIGSGTLANARISPGSVTQHSPPPDLTAVRQDIAMLALYNAVSDNRAAYNLPFSFIDQFEDDTGTTTRTDVTNVSEYFATSSSSSGAPYIYPTNPSANTTPSSSPNLQPNTGVIGSVLHNDDWTSISDTKDSQNYLNGWVYEDYGSGNEKSFGQSALRMSGSATGAYNVHASNDAASWTLIHTGASGNFGTATSGSGTQTIGGLVYQFTAPATAYRYWRMTITAHSGNTSANDLTEMKFYEPTSTSTFSATGTLISDTQTSSVATTKMSGVILYKDNGSGASALGTHLKIYLTANLQGTSPNWTGTDWKEVVAGDFGAVTPLFSAGVKMVRLAEQTVVSGTACAMKAVWASQASGTLETQLHGWAVNY